MNGRASHFGAITMLAAGVAHGQAPSADPSVPAPAPPGSVAPAPSPPPPPVDEAAPPPTETAPQPEPEPEQPRPRVRWAEPERGAEEEEDSSVEGAAAEGTDEQEGPAAAPREGWSLEGSHFVLSVERITSVLAWSNVATSTGSGVEVEAEASGTDVAFLGAGWVRTASALPRLAFDAVLDVGFTIGGSLSYMTAANGESVTRISGVGSDDATTKLPDQSISIFAPRLGALLTPTHNVGVWLRGGITRIGTTETITLFAGSDIVTQELDTTVWQLALDPQVVLVPAPRVAITIAAILDIGLPGTAEGTVVGGSATSKTDLTGSAYGVSAGLAAIF